MLRIYVKEHIAGIGLNWGIFRFKWGRAPLIKVLHLLASKWKKVVDLG